MSELRIGTVFPGGAPPAIPARCPTCGDRWRAKEHVSVNPPNGSFRGVIAHCVRGHRHAFGGGVLGREIPS